MQNKIGKFALQVPPSSGNVQVTVDAGLLPIRYIICQKVISYAQKLMTKQKPRLASISFKESFAKTSKYSLYVISQLKMLPTYPHFPTNLNTS